MRRTALPRLRLPTAEGWVLRAHATARSAFLRLLLPRPVVRREVHPRVVGEAKALEGAEDSSDGPVHFLNIVPVRSVAGDARELLGREERGVHLRPPGKSSGQDGARALALGTTL